jgi:endonuclease G
MRGKLNIFIIVFAVLFTLSLLSKVQCRGEGRDEAAVELTPQEAVSEVDAGDEAARKHRKDTNGDELLMVKGGDVQVLRKTGFVTGYAKEWRLPMWTAWNLTASHTTGPYKRKGVKFQEDDEVPYPKAMNSDYYSSGYDRGHMCPSGDNKWSRQAQEDCFLFTNMCPQSHNLNGGDWNDLEMKCRTWAKRYGNIYIVCGPVFRNSRPSRTIGRNRVWVPDGFYKVVLRMNQRSDRGRQRGDAIAAIGFYYDNEDGHRPLSDYVMTVDEVEEMTGLDFFSALGDKTEQRIEANADLRDW